MKIKISGIFAKIITNTPDERKEKKMKKMCISSQIALISNVVDSIHIINHSLENQLLFFKTQI